MDGAVQDLRGRTVVVTGADGWAVQLGRSNV